MNAATIRRARPGWSIRATEKRIRSWRRHHPCMFIPGGRSPSPWPGGNLSSGSTPLNRRKISTNAAAKSHPATRMPPKTSTSSRSSTTATSPIHQKVNPSFGPKPGSRNFPRTILSNTHPTKAHKGFPGHGLSPSHSDNTLANGHFRDSGLAIGPKIAHLVPSSYRLPTVHLHEAR